MRLTRKQKITSAIAACAVGALAVIGGTYATFTSTDTADGQVITSASSGLTFTDDISTGVFGATYSNLAAGDSQVSYINLNNTGSNTLDSFRISQLSAGTGLATMGAAGTEGLSIQVDRVNFGADTVLGGADDTLVPVIANVKLASLAPGTFLAAPVAALEVSHLKFTVTLDTAAAIQNQSLSTTYTVNANQDMTP